MANKRHAAALCLTPNCFASGALGADKQNATATSSEVFHKTTSFLVHRYSLLKVNDMNVVAFAENEGCHFRVPITGLMPEMYACF